ncbi:MAG TPA: DUF6803 family protein [Methanocella sp.]|jgi:hypothetical protein
MATEQMANAMPQVSADMGATITHYMGLLMDNQPWNLLIFMAIPVALAEALTVSEFFVIFNRLYEGKLRELNKWIGTVLGVYFLGVFLYLMAFVVPSIQWRGIIDITAVGFYLSGVIFLFGITLVELGVIGKGYTNEKRMQLHFLLLAGFLIVAHIAMIFGMANPTLI